MRNRIQARLPRGLVVAVISGAMAGAVLVGVPAATSTARSSHGSASSPNVQLLSNTPKEGPFTVPGAYATDLAFQGRYAYQGNYNGFSIWDLREPASPTLVTQVVCPGDQNDVSVLGNLMFLSTDSSRSDDSCSSRFQSSTIKSSWEGIKIFDISDPAAPRYVKSVETNCGSHTHTLVPGRGADAQRTAYLYVSSYLPDRAYPDCQPPHDKISIVKVPLANPQSASVVATPVLFPRGGNPGDPGSLLPTSGCHDITVYPSKDLAAGACMGDGVLMNIRDREKPRVIDVQRDTRNFAFWHSATFNNSGTKVVYTDELGGGGAATCNPRVGPNRGANGIYDIAGTGDDRTLTFASYYKIPRVNGPTENCVAHNGSLLPVPGRDIMVQAWYQGGVSIYDFTDSTRPKEIGWFDRGPLQPADIGGSWSAYYYNGYIYSSEIARGFDVLQISDPRTDPAASVRLRRLNVQTQESFR
ncbi:MAG: LVIVD repeat-containing protein [Angustibacter sp.]